MSTEKWSPHGVLFAGKTEASVPVTFEELAPDNSLKRFIACYWSMSWNLPDQERLTILAVPSGSFNLIFNRDHPTDWQGYLTGIRKSAHPFEVKGRGSNTGVRFAPGGFSAFSRDSAANLADQSLPVAQVLPNFRDEVMARILSAQNLTEMKIAIEPTLSSSIVNDHKQDFVLLDAFFSILAERDGPIDLSDIVSTLKTNIRTLQRLFEQRVGVSPKTILKTKRFQSVANSLISGKEIDWADFALEMGYYDQSHLINDFKAITGVSPRDFQLKE